MKIEWTQEKQDKVCEKIEKWIREQGLSATAGEGIQQSDSCLESLPDLMSDIVDDIIKPEIEESD